MPDRKKEQAYISILRMLENLNSNLNLLQIKWREGSKSALSPGSNLFTESVGVLKYGTSHPFTWMLHYLQNAGMVFLQPYYGPSQAKSCSWELWPQPQDSCISVCKAFHMILLSVIQSDYQEHQQKRSQGRRHTWAFLLTYSGHNHHHFFH